MPKRVVRKIRIKKLPLLIVIFLMVVVIGSLVAIFFDYYGKIKDAPPNVGLVGLSSLPKVIAPVAPSPSSVASDVDIPIKEIKSDTIVPETIPVDDIYFKDALFIGDSILKGFKLWTAPYPENVVADQNVGLDQIFNDKDIYYVTSTQKTTLWKAIEQKLPNPAKIYVLLGTNGIPGYENDRHMVFYNDLIKKLKEKFPDAVIYIESVTPITQAVSTKRAPKFTTQKINAFNELVLQMAKDMGVYYLKIEDVLKDENGYLKASYDAGDGTHMPKDGHMAVLKYLKSHTVSPEGIAQVKDETKKEAE